MHQRCNGSNARAFQFRQALLMSIGGAACVTACVMGCGAQNRAGDQNRTVEPQVTERQVTERQVTERQVTEPPGRVVAGGPTGEVAAPEVAPPEGAGSANVALAWEQVPQADRKHLQRIDGIFEIITDDPEPAVRSPIATPPRTLALNLDGDHDLEWVLAANIWPEHAYRCGEQGCETALWFFDNVNGAPRYAGTLSWFASSADPGTYYSFPGLAVLRAEHVAGRDFLRLEHNDVNGGSDPRYVSRNFALVHLVNGMATAALNLTVSSVFESGPEREQTGSQTRSIAYQPDGTIAYRYVENGRRRCRATLRFDGTTFVPDNAACFAR